MNRIFVSIFLFIFLSGFLWPPAYAVADESGDLKKLTSEASSKCAQAQSVTCMIDAFEKLRASQGRPISLTWEYNSNGVDNAFVRAVIDEGYSEKAVALLKEIPEYFGLWRMHLYFAAGEFDKGVDLLRKVSVLKYKGDHGTILTLMNSGNLDGALEVAKMTIDWHPLYNNWSARMAIDCGEDVRSYPTPIEALAIRFVQRKDYTKAYQALDLLRHYWNEKLYGRYRYNCAHRHAKWAYYGTMNVLAQALASEGEREKAKALFEEMQAKMPEFGGSDYFMPNYTTLAINLVEAGFKDEAAALARRKEIKESVLSAESKEAYADMEALILKIAGRDEEAQQRVRAIESEEIKKRTMAALGRMSAPPANERDGDDFANLWSSSVALCYDPVPESFALSSSCYRDFFERIRYRDLKPLVSEAIPDRIR